VGCRILGSNIHRRGRPGRGVGWWWRCGGLGVGQDAFLADDDGHDVGVPGLDQCLVDGDGAAVGGRERGSQSMRNLLNAALKSNEPENRRSAAAGGGNESRRYPKPAELLFRVGATILVAVCFGVAGRSLRPSAEPLNRLGLADSRKRRQNRRSPRPRGTGESWASSPVVWSES